MFIFYIWIIIYISVARLCLWISESVIRSIYTGHSVCQYHINCAEPEFSLPVHKNWLKNRSSISDGKNFQNINASIFQYIVLQTSISQKISYRKHWHIGISALLFNVIIPKSVFMFMLNDILFKKCLLTFLH